MKLGHERVESPSIRFDCAMFRGGNGRRLSDEFENYFMAGKISFEGKFSINF